MTIDEQIKALEYLKKCGIFPFSDTRTGIVITDEYVDGAINTMRKYQKIEQAIDKVEEYICDVETDTVKAQGMAQALDIFEQVLGEVEDGNDDN